MRGYVSFHAIDLSFFDELIASLVIARKVDPEPFLRRATRIRRNRWLGGRFVAALERLAAASLPPEPDPGMTPWKRLRASLERIDFRPDELARKSARALDDDRYLDGRPFLIAEGSAEKVAVAVEAFATADSETAVEKIARGQIAHLDAELADGVELGDDAELSSEHAYRDELLGALTKIHELSRLALPDELPWRAVSMHACAAPFWTGRDVDGLETVCRAANVPSPDCLNPAWRVFSEACDAFPTLRERLGVELKLPHDVGAFVAPGEIDRLLLFLTEYGARIISAAARGGEGPAATALLRKIRECALYAGRHGYGYLEASGIAPVPATKPDAHAH